MIRKNILLILILLIPGIINAGLIASVLLVVVE